ncbi:hypothetical protein [Microseira wollei]|uniref:Uncharacterized protein n=1 Tax=Microseira wollei NIES-4236 TaxID=2530354 RepID=A0AAV3XS58_9CYAN|nr:hypothetical protein [Microseira wollei]GET43799.1 hypothetical protein MiSe_86250 [Microseira wollei NIES-4236]
MDISTPSQLFDFGYSDAKVGKQPQSNALLYLKGYAAGSVAADQVLLDRLARIRQIKASLQVQFATATTCGF